MNILKNIKKHRKNIEQFEETIKTFIKEFEMNVNFNIHNNIYDSFITIYQYENNKNGNILKYLRHFYYYDPNEEEEILEGEDEEGEESNENDIEYIDSYEEDEDDDKNKKNSKNKKGEIRIEITPIYKKGFNQKKNKSNDKKEEGKSLEQKDKKEFKNKNDKRDKKDKNNLKNIKPLLSSIKKIPLLKDIQRKITKPKRFIDFNHDITLYYYIANDKNEFVEEYGFENAKLKYYEGSDLEESLDDTFMQHCDDLHQIEKKPLFLTKDYFEHEFSLFNLFTIENKKEKIKLGDFFNKLWIENGNISIFDSYLNYILNRFLLLDKFIKINRNEEEEDDIQYIIQKKINKELEIDNDFLYYIGKLDLDFGINNRSKYTSFHEIGVFLKIVFIFLTILDRTTSLTDEEEKEEEFYNELRFYDIQDAERGEFEEVLDNLSSTFESFFESDDNESDDDINNIEEKELSLIPYSKNLENKPLNDSIRLFFEKDVKSILFGIRMKLWNEYMTEYINKMYYDKKTNKSSFIKYYDDFIEDIKKLIKNNYNLKELESILIKWEEFKDIHTLYNVIVGNIIRLH